LKVARLLGAGRAFSRYSEMDDMELSSMTLLVGTPLSSPRNAWRAPKEPVRGLKMFWLTEPTTSVKSPPWSEKKAPQCSGSFAVGACWPRSAQVGTVRYCGVLLTLV